MTVVEGLDLAAVQKFFDAEVPEIRGPLRAELIHGGRSNLTYRLTDGYSTWVLRRPPLGGLTPSAHDPAGDSPPMDLRWAVVDPERPHLTQEPAQRQVPGDPQRSADLHGPVDHPPDGLRAEGLRDRS